MRIIGKNVSIKFARNTNQDPADAACPTVDASTVDGHAAESQGLSMDKTKSIMDKADISAHITPDGRSFAVTDHGDTSTENAAAVHSGLQDAGFQHVATSDGKPETQADFFQKGKTGVAVHATDGQDAATGYTYKAAGVHDLSSSDGVDQKKPKVKL